MSTSARSATLVFDGDCGFCTTAVNWLEAHLPVSPPSVPFQWADLEKLGLSEDEARERVWLITAEQDGTDHQYGGHLALAALLRHQPHPGWRFLGWILVSPLFSPVAAIGYSLVARYRYLLPGGTPACRMPK